MDELLELFKGQLSYEYFEKLTYKELDLFKKSRVERIERQNKRENERPKIVR